MINVWIMCILAITSVDIICQHVPTIPNEPTGPNYVILDAVVLEQTPPESLPAWIRAEIAKTGLPWRIRDQASGIEFILVPPGEHVRPALEYGEFKANGTLRALLEGRADRGEHPVQAISTPCQITRITHPFYLARYETKQSEWVQAVGEYGMRWMGPRPLRGRFRDEQLYNNAPIDLKGFGYPAVFCAIKGVRLPTEAEWEHAASLADVGETRFESVAWTFAQTHGLPRDVGLKAADNLGLFDLFGNLPELTADWFAPMHDWAGGGTLIDPSGPAFGTQRVIRGGGGDEVERRRLTPWFRDQSFANEGLSGGLGLRPVKDPLIVDKNDIVSGGTVLTLAVPVAQWRNSVLRRLQVGLEGTIGAAVRGGSCRIIQRMRPNGLLELSFASIGRLYCRIIIHVAAEGNMKEYVRGLVASRTSAGWSRKDSESDLTDAAVFVKVPPPPKGVHAGDVMQPIAESIDHDRSVCWIVRVEGWDPSFDASEVEHLTQEVASNAHQVASRLRTLISESYEEVFSLVVRQLGTR